MSVRQIPWAAQSWAALAMHGAVVAALLAAAGGELSLSAQETPDGRPATRRLSDMLPQPESQVYYDESANAPKRYEEPAPPPFDFWQPTWMPCQTLRTNRSLVLGHLYYGMDMMGWATKGVHAPALLTVSSLSDGGVIGQGNTSVVAGDSFIQNEMRPGGKLTIGWWFDPNQTSGVEFHYFELDGRRGRIDAAEDTGTFVIARPIIDAGSSDNAAVITASDDQNGSIRISTRLQLTSTGIVFNDLLWANQFTRIDYLAGYRHAHLADRIRIDESIVGVTGNGDFDSGDEVTRIDQFRTVNQFDGADFGLKGWWSKNGKLAITGLAKIAIGANNNNVIIDGITSVNGSSTNGGVLTQPSNIGRVSQQQFGIVSEVGLGLEWRPACLWKFNLGYTWFYWSEVARAASQIDTTVDPSGGGSRPAFNMHTTSFWAQGLNAGFTYQF